MISSASPRLCDSALKNGRLLSASLRELNLASYYSFWQCHAMRNLILLSLIFLFTSLAAKEIALQLEHAVTPMQMAQGLMQRKELPENGGMTFNYGEPRPIKIWMYNCLMDLSVAFLDENKVIQEIHELKCYPDIHDPFFFDEHSVTAAKPVAFALEMNPGWFAKNGVSVGDRAEWDTNSPRGRIITR